MADVLRNARFDFFDITALGGKLQKYTNGGFMVIVAVNGCLHHPEMARVILTLKGER